MFHGKTPRVLLNLFQIPNSIRFFSFFTSSFLAIHSLDPHSINGMIHPKVGYILKEIGFSSICLTLLMYSMITIELKLVTNGNKVTTKVKALLFIPIVSYMFTIIPLMAFEIYYNYQQHLFLLPSKILKNNGSLDKLDIRKFLLFSLYFLLLELEKYRLFLRKVYGTSL